MSTKQRASIFGEEPEMDLSQFEPKQAGVDKAPPKEKVRAVAETASFKSREAKPDVVRTEEPKREQRRYRTGRNLQLSLKVTQETLSLFYSIADKNGWVLGKTLDRALLALQKELSGERPQ